MLPSYRHQSIDFKAFIKPFDALQANQSTGVSMRETLAFNGLREKNHWRVPEMIPNILYLYVIFVKCMYVSLQLQKKIFGTRWN